jgi:hypothetical protein
MLAHPAPQHRRGHVPASPLLLRLMQNVQDDALLASQPVADIGNLVETIYHTENVAPEVNEVETKPCADAYSA